MLPNYRENFAWAHPIKYRYAEHQPFSQFQRVERETNLVGAHNIIQLGARFSF